LHIVSPFAERRHKGVLVVPQLLIMLKLVLTHPHSLGRLTCTFDHSSKVLEKLSDNDGLCLRKVFVVFLPDQASGCQCTRLPTLSLLLVLPRHPMQVWHPEGLLSATTMSTWVR